MNKEKIDHDIKNLILWRIETNTPKNFKLSMGSSGTFTKDEMKKHVENEDKIGVEIINMQLKFIRALSNGQITKTLAEG
ncbi:MAG: hypothetical protein KJ697_01655 [Nanoarchaeota archaeon]|nr:hypothetical protein [Nanoarchaeota archaeon]